jgi:hypothetical protein
MCVRIFVILGLAICCVGDQRHRSERQDVRETVGYSRQVD